MIAPNTSLENKIERNEKMAKFSVFINRDLLRQMKTESTSEREIEMLEKFERLPEELQFQSGMNLIVGENATGKSTLAKALFLAIKVEQYCKYAEEFFELRKTSGLPTGSDKFNKDEIVESVLNPSNPTDQIWMAEAGMASKLARAMKISELIVEDDKIPPTYVDVGKINGMQARLNQQLLEDTSRNVLENVRELTMANKMIIDNQKDKQREQVIRNIEKRAKERGSSRQSVEVSLAKEMYGDTQKKEGRIFFVDEPEEGISPTNHMRLPHKINEIIGDSSIAVVPTNSMILYFGNHPRIDLKYPERGVFVPSDYPDYLQKERKELLKLIQGE